MGRYGKEGTGRSRLRGGTQAQRTGWVRSICDVAYGCACRSPDGAQFDAPSKSQSL